MLSDADDTDSVRYIDTGFEGKIRHRHRISIDPRTILLIFCGQLVLLMLLLSLLIMTFQIEIRCALGSERACVSLQAPATPKPITERAPQP